MSFLTINGIDIPVKNDAAGVTVETLSPKQRTASGLLVGGSEKSRRVWEFETIPLQHQFADNIGRIGAGAFHSFPMSDGFWSWSGMTEAYGSTVLSNMTFNPDYTFTWNDETGAANLNGTLNFYTQSDAHTVLYWGIDGPRFYRSDGYERLDSTVSMASTTDNLTITFSGNTIFSNLVIFPYETSGYVIDGFLGMVNKYGRSPNSVLSGDIVDGEQINVDFDVEASAVYTSNDIEYILKITAREALDGFHRG